MSEIPNYAEEAYKAYTATTDNKNFRGEECPAFPDLPDKIQAAWQAAANKTRDVSLAESEHPTTITEIMERLEIAIEAHKKDFPSGGREFAVALTHLQTARLWFKEGLTKT